MYNVAIYLNTFLPRDCTIVIEENQNSEEPIGRIYEHPFTERMRLFLRLEALFMQAEAFKMAGDQYQSQLCLDAMFALHDLTNRYELRAELLRELERIRHALGQISKRKGADIRLINDTLKKINQHSKTLHELGPNHIGRVRNVRFLNDIRNKNSGDLGCYLFELPALQHWMGQSPTERQRQIRTWLLEFLPLKKVLEFILKFTRENREEEDLVASYGAYVHKMEELYGPQQLLRIILPKNAQVFPRLTGDKSRFVIRFMTQKQIDMKAIQATRNISFKIHTCGI